MNAARLASLLDCGVAYDLESHRVQPGLLAPPLVCGSVGWYGGVDGSRGYPEPRIAGRLLSKSEAIETGAELLADDRAVIVGANIAFDMAVLANEAGLVGVDLYPLIFAAYANDRIFDVQHAEALHGVAQGHLLKDPRTGVPLRDPESGEQCGYRLSVVVDLVLGRVNAKENDRWRESYALLADVPIEQWPEDARTYPVDDARNTIEAALAQVGHVPNVGAHAWGPDFVCTHCGASCDHHASPVCRAVWPRRNLHDLSAQCYAAFALHLGAVWGMRTDRAAIDAIERACAEERAAGLPALIAAGFIRGPESGKKAGSEDQAVVKRAVALAYGCTGTCSTCGGTQKTASAKTGKPINCVACSSTGLDLSTAPVPKTDPTDKFPNGQVQAGRDVLVESGDELLMEYASAQEDDKILDTYVPALRAGQDAPWTQRPNTILETGRASYSGVIMLLPRQVSARLAAKLKTIPGAPVGVRDCIVARPEHGYYSVDFKGGELVTFAESCVLRVGYSELGKALNLGLDAHAALGATMLGWSYEKMAAVLKDKKHPEYKRAKAFRQCAKWGNFGFMGGMGPVKFVLTQRRQGEDTPHASGPSMIWDGKEFVRGYKGLRLCILVAGTSSCGEHKVTSWKDRPCPPTCRACIEVAIQIRDAWFRQWPEARPYLDWHARNSEEVGEVVQHYTNRIRGGCEFNSEANGDFQALLADIAKRALCRVVREQYDRTLESVLYGSRNEVFEHDELFGEARLEVLPECAERIVVVMKEEFRKLCPHHEAACDAEPALAARWWKAMSPVRDEAGRLKLWTP
jgi:DNA polymerase-1